MRVANYSELASPRPPAGTARSLAEPLANRQSRPTARRGSGSPPLFDSTDRRRDSVVIVSSPLPFPAAAS